MSQPENSPLPPLQIDDELKPVDISTLPPLPPSPALEEGEQNLDIETSRELTVDNLEKHNELRNELIETPSIITEQKPEIVDEATRLLNEVQEADDLIDKQQKELKNIVEPVIEEVKEEIIEEVKEEIIEEVKESDLVEDVTTLATLVSLILANKDTSSQSISISDDEKLVLMTILDIDGFLDEVETILKYIIHDNKIDANDVPKIMILTVKLYELLQETSFEFDVELCGSILKTLFQIAIKEKLIPINDEELELIKCLSQIVDTSVRLLATKTNDKKKNGLLQCVIKFFNGCK